MRPMVIITIALTCLLIGATGTIGHGPSKMVLEYDFEEQVLNVTITHSVGDPNDHYVEQVIIEVNGSHYMTENYTSQPTSSTFTYTYNVTASDGEEIEAEAECNKGGTISQTTTAEYDDDEPANNQTPEGTLDGIITDGEYEFNKMFDDGDYIVYWTISSDQAHFGIVADTDGWVAIGFEPSQAMKDADMILGNITDGGNATIIDAFSTGNYGPHEDDRDLGGTYDLIDFGITEIDGNTTMEFIRNLTTGDDKDQDIPETGNLTIVWAYGSDDDLTEKHKERGTGTLMISPYEPEPSASALDGTVEPGEYAFSASFGGGDLVLHWRIESDLVRMAMVGQTSGWVSIGFEPDQAMKNADMVIGYVSSGTAFVIDAHSTGPTGPHPPDTSLGGTNDIKDFNGTETGGRTTIEFIRALDTGDPYDKPLKREGPIDIIWAIGGSDDFDDPHGRGGRGSGTIDLATGESTEDEEIELWPIHAGLMIISFILMGTAVTIAMAMRKRKWWLKTHKTLNLIAIILLVVGVIIAFYMVEESTGEHFRIGHAYLGAVTAVFAISTAVIGLTMKGNKKLRTVHRWLGRVTLLAMVATILGGLNAAGLY